MCLGTDAVIHAPHCGTTGLIHSSLLHDLLNHLLPFNRRSYMLGEMESIIPTPPTQLIRLQRAPSNPASPLTHLCKNETLTRTKWSLTGKSHVILSQQITHQTTSMYSCVTPPSSLSSSCCLAEKEQRGELRRGQRGGDPGEQTLRGRPRRLGSVHTQGLSHRQTHPVLVLCHSASSRPSSGGGVLECLPLYANPVS